MSGFINSITIFSHFYKAHHHIIDKKSLCYFDRESGQTLEVDFDQQCKLRYLYGKELLNCIAVYPTLLGDSVLDYAIENIIERLSCVHRPMAGSSLLSGTDDKFFKSEVYQ